MSDAAIELASPQPTGLMAWLRFDQSRVAEVEAAYDSYISTTRPGVFTAVALPAGILIALVAAIFVYAFAGLHARALATVWATIAAIVGVYAMLFVPVLRCPCEIRRTLLVGCTDVRRTCVFAFLIAFAITFLEIAVILTLELVHVALPKALPDIFVGGMAFGAVLAAVVAPIAEEFLVQGWFQTRMRRFGSVWSAVIATVFFIIIHVPKNPYDIVRGGNLAFAAYLRATTRSLLACIVAHACNNLIIFSIVLVYVLTTHHAVPR